MPASGNWDALGDWSDVELPFTADEIRRALEWRQRHCAMTVKRRDYCPHAVPCESVTACLDKMAWYFRHRHVIEATA